MILSTPTDAPVVSNILQDVPKQNNIYFSKLPN